MDYRLLLSFRVGWGMVTISQFSTIFYSLWPMRYVSSAKSDMLTTGTYRGYGGRRAGLEFEDSASALTLSSVWLIPPTLDSSYLSCTRTHCTIVPGFSSALTGSGRSTYIRRPLLS